MAIVNIRHALLALSALALPRPRRAIWRAVAAAVRTPPPPMPPQCRRRVAEPWMAPPPGRHRSRGARQHPRPARAARAAALEPIDLPPSVEQGVDMIYIDEDLVPRAVQDTVDAARHLLQRVERRSGRHVRVDEPDLHRPSPRPRQVSPEVGRPAADRDPRRAGAEARLDRRPRRRCFAPASGFPTGGGYDAALATAGQGISRTFTASRPTAPQVPARSMRSTAARNITSS